MTNPVSMRFPFELKDQPHEVVQAHRFSFQGLVDLNQAISSLKGQITALKSASSSGSTSTTATIETITVESILAGIGTVNDQTGQTSYTTQSQDAGALLILNDASPVAVSLNSAVSKPFALFISNFGTGLTTLTPTSGTVNGGASLALSQNQSIWCVFDGTDWKTWAFFAPPQTLTKVTHEWMDSYDAATGLFTKSQPAYSDISGTPQIPNTIASVPGEYVTGYDATTGNFSQSTPAGISATITTAALTGTGTQGSMTFTNGILTAQTPAT